MKINIRSFSVVQTSKIVAVLYFVLSLLFIPFLLTAFLANPQMSKGAWFLVLAPFAYGIMGFVITAIMCLIYNLLAKWIGGIEFTTEEK